MTARGSGWKQDFARSLSEVQSLSNENIEKLLNAGERDHEAERQDTDA